jgi:hypothetical protein
MKEGRNMMETIRREQGQALGTIDGVAGRMRLFVVPEFYEDWPPEEH